MKSLEYRDVFIRWRDEVNAQQVTVAVDGEWNPIDGDDDGVFFWFASEAEYQECLKNGEAEFVMFENEEDEDA